MSVFRQPERPRFYVGYLATAKGTLATYMDDEAGLREVFDHVAVDATDPSAVRLELSSPLRPGDVRELTERDEITFTVATGHGSVSSVRLVAEPPRRKPEADVLQTGAGALAEVSNRLGVRVVCEGPEAGPLMSATADIAASIALAES